MNIQLIAVDLDGTLLNSEKQISPQTFRIMDQAARNGCLIVPATGRAWKGVPDFLKQLPFVRYMLTLNGAAVIDTKEKGTVIYESFFKKEEALKLWDFVQKYHTMTDVHINGMGRISSYYLEHCEEYAVSPQIAKLIKDTRKETPDVRKLIEETGYPVEKLNLTFKLTDMKNREKALNEISGFPFVSVTTSIPNNIEVNSAGATKGAGLTALAEYLHISMEHVMAFGDGGNDISMIRAAGYGIAMGNAVEAVKQEAFYVTESNDDDGVAKAIEKWVLDE